MRFSTSKIFFTRYKNLVISIKLLIYEITLGLGSSLLKNCLVLGGPYCRG